MDMTDSDVIALLTGYHDAMVAGDTSALETLLKQNFTLVHITGYVQPRSEWFEVIRKRQFEYHRITVDLAALNIRRHGDLTFVEGRGVFDATIYGTRRPWRLALKVSMSNADGRAVIHHAVYEAY